MSSTSILNKRERSCSGGMCDKHPTTVALFDCWQTDKEMVISGDFPGASGNDFDIDFHDQLLTIRCAVENTEGDGELLRSEFKHVGFERSFHIGEDVEADAIRATYEDAVLTVVLPIVQPAVPRKIAVSTS